MCACTVLGTYFALTKLIGTNLIADNVGLLRKYPLHALFCA